MLVFLLSALETDADRSLFTEIYEQYHDRMEQTAIRILKNQQDAEDALQNAFLQIIRNFNKISEIQCKDRGYWCISIVKNEALIILRKKQRIVLKDKLEEEPAAASMCSTTSSRSGLQHTKIPANLQHGSSKIRV